MGKKAPSAPDPQATARAQGAVNTDTARLEARMNRGDITTPFGTVTNRDMGADWMTRQWAPYEEMFARGDANPYFVDEQGNRAFDRERLWRDLNAQNPDRDRWMTTVNVSPEIMGLYSSALATPYAMDDADARDRATAGIMARMEPQFAQDRAALESRLVAQGFTPGSEGYARAADELSRARTDARMQAITAGLGESRAAAGFQNALRQQRMNEVGMMFGLGQTAPSSQPVNVASPDLMGAVYNNYAQRSANANASNANWFGLLGAGVGAAGRYFGR